MALNIKVLKKNASPQSTAGVVNSDRRYEYVQYAAEAAEKGEKPLTYAEWVRKQSEGK